jgi:4-amino-4-deoxy-L-arabinose transferase-like glycosyltransferase
VLTGLREGLTRAFPPQPSLDHRARVSLGVVLALGAVARVAWVLAAAQRPEALRDPSLYLILGEMVADGNGYEYPGEEGGVTAYYPPGYPLALGALGWLVRLLPLVDLSLFGVAIAFNVVLSVATIALVFELGRRLVSVSVGLAAAAVMALWPNLIFHTGVILTETLFLFLLVAMLLVALATPEVARAPGRWRMLSTGVLLGLVGMVRPTSFVIAPLFLLLWWREGVATALRRTALVGVAVLLVVLPWTARNVVRMDSAVLISTNMGDNLCMGHHPGATGTYSFADDHYCFVGLQSGERPDFETERQSETLDRALTHMRREPSQIVGLMPAKLRYTLDSDADGLAAATDYGAQRLFGDGYMDLLRWSANAYYAVVGILGLGGAVLLVARREAARRQLFLVLAGAVQLVPPLLTFGDPRFKMPLYPTLAVCAGAAAVALAGRFRKREPMAAQQSEQRVAPRA